LKILIYDIETTPILGYTWGTWNTNVIQVKQDWQMICFAYKWYGSKARPAFVRPPLGDPWNDKAMVKELWTLFDEADVLVGHNVDKFDTKKVNALFLRHGLRPPSPTKSVDTLKVSRRNFSNSSNKLDSLTQMLDLGKKTENAGYMKLFNGCMLDDDPKMWRLMERYNKQDIVLTERLYLMLLPWMKSHPVDLDNPDGCRACGHTKLQKRGFQDTNTFRYQRYQCPKCGKWHRGRTRIPLDKKPEYT